MKTKEFWDLIEKSIQQKDTIDKNDQADAIAELIKDFPLEKLVAFQNKVNQLKQELNSSLFEDVAIMMKYKDNETAYSGFKNWVIALGKEHYNRTKKSPSHLLTLENPELFVAGRPYFSDLDFVASIVYYDRTDDDALFWSEFFMKTNRMNELEKQKKKDRQKQNDISR